MTTMSRRNFVRAGVATMIGAEFGAGRALAAGVAQSAARSKVEFTAVKALVFDTFGTVVDWRTSVPQEVEQLAKKKGLKVDAEKFADAWRAGYGPSMNRVRTGELPWTKLDVLHRMILDKILVDFGMQGLSEDEIEHAQSRVASAAAVARFGERPDATEEAIHHRAALERQHLADDGPGEVRGPAVGLHPRSGAGAALQARPRGLQVGCRIPRLEGRRRHDGRRASRRSEGGEGRRAEDRVRPAAARVRPAG